MTNHVRTLLLNARPSQDDPLPAGEEFVPADFIPVQLPGWLSRARASLFGSGADRAGTNLNLGRLLAAAHASEFAADITASDSRITYDPALPAGNFLATAALTAEVLTGSAVRSYAGQLAFDQPGRGGGTWYATWTGSTAAVTAGDGSVWTGSPADDGAGAALQLPGSTVTVRVRYDEPGSWVIRLSAPPAYRFATAAAYQIGTDPVFRPAVSARETAWAEAWQDHPLPSVRAVALALAIAARTDSVRLTGSP